MDPNSVIDPSAVSQSIQPDLSVRSSNFPNIALRKMRSSLFSFTAQANQTCENITNPVRDFIRPYQQTGNVLRMYGAADALNFSFSLCGLYYFLRHAYQNYDQMLSPQVFSLSSQEFHNAESTPEGLALTVMFTVFLVGFSTLGSHYDENKDEPWVKNLVFAWPYFRTAWKQFKWWGKGWWAFLSLLAQYQFAEQDFLIKMMFPLAVMGGLFAALNSMWLRWMRDQRKDMVKNNLDLIEGIKSPLHQLDKMPKSLIGFERSLIFLQETTDGQETKSLYYVNVHQNEDGTAEIKADPIEMTESEWQDLCLKIESLQTDNIHSRLKQYLNYINRLSVPSTVVPGQAAQAMPPIHLHFVAKMSDFREGELLITDERGGQVWQRALNSYIYFSQAEDLKDEQRLYYCNSEGVLIPQRDKVYRANSEGELIEQGEKSTLFHKKYLEVQQDKNVLNLSTLQLKSIQHVKLKRYTNQIGHNYDEFVTMRQDILKDNDTPHEFYNWLFPTKTEPNKIKTQHWLDKTMAPIAAGASAVGDGLYFYIFVAKITIATLSPTWALIVLGAAATLFVICMITRIAEEFDFQRRLEVTALRTEAELSKKDCLFLHEYLEKFLDHKESESTLEAQLQPIIEAVERSREAREAQLKRYDIVPTKPYEKDTKTMSQHNRNVVLLWKELADELLLSKKLQDELRLKLDRSELAAALVGLQNGLAIQGAVASFSFMFATLCYTSAAACPPAFMLTCLAIGFAAIIISLVQAIVSYYFYLDRVKQTKEELSLEFNAEMLVKMTGENGKLGDPSALRQNMEYINNQPLEPPADFVVIEWSEIFRLLFKGAVKGRNAAIEILARFLEGSDNKWWLLPVVVVAGAASFAWALGMRATAKGFAVGRPDALNTGNADGKARTFFDGEKIVKKKDPFSSSICRAINQQSEEQDSDSDDETGFDEEIVIAPESWQSSTTFVI